MTPNPSPSSTLPPPPRHLAVLLLVLDLWLPKKPKVLPRRHFQRPNAMQHQTGDTAGHRWGVVIDGGWNRVMMCQCSFIFFGIDILILFIYFYLKLAASSLSGILPYFVKMGKGATATFHHLRIGWLFFFPNGLSLYAGKKMGKQRSQLAKPYWDRSIHVHDGSIHTVSPKVSGTQNGGTEPYKAILGMGFPYISLTNSLYRWVLPF